MAERRGSRQIYPTSDAAQRPLGRSAGPDYDLMNLGPVRAAVEPPDPSWRKLTRAEEAVIVHRGTERPFSGEYEHNVREGTYACKRCGAALYRSRDKFDARCGWPSFDQEVPGAVQRVPDPDGERTEIRCARCAAHLGHVFEGEGFTARNVRHCVNSISLTFTPAEAQP